jgi:hypothetical protein
MEIVSIFGKNLFAIRYTGEDKDEFSRVFELWQDAEYLEEFFETQKSDLENGFWGNISIENAILDTFEYAQEFENKLLELSEKSDSKQIEGLEDIFRPLHDSQYQILTLNKSKAKQTWLRLYALRVEDNVYIITGGAIKLTQKMQDRKHTNLELRKIESCRRFLLDQGIVDVEGVIEKIES